VARLQERVRREELQVVTEGQVHVNDRGELPAETIQRNTLVD
jgi:stress response protein YsnF